MNLNFRRKHSRCAPARISSTNSSRKIQNIQMKSMSCALFHKWTSLLANINTKAVSAQKSTVSRCTANVSRKGGFATRNVNAIIAQTKMAASCISIRPNNLLTLGILVLLREFQRLCQRESVLVRNQSVERIIVTVSVQELSAHKSVNV